MSEIAQLLAGALVMIGALGLASQFAPRLLAMGLGLGARADERKTPKRIRVLETHQLEGGRRLTLVRWDDREHLILSGGDEDVVVETRPAPGSSISAGLGSPLSASHGVRPASRASGMIR